MTGDPFDAPVLASQEHPSRVLRRLSRSPGYPERLTADLGTRVEVPLSAGDRDTRHGYRDADAGLQNRR